MKKTIILSLSLVFLMLVYPVSAYEITYKIQDDGSALPVEGNNPSVFWPGNCDIEMTLRNTAGHSGSYTITNYYYSPNDDEVGYAPLDLDNNISCRLINTDPIGGGASLNGFYESSIDSSYSSDDFNAWLTSVYDCEFDSNEIFFYNNTAGTDSYGNHPFAYIRRTISYCAVAAACTSPALVDDENKIINHLETRYYPNCENNLTVDREKWNTFFCGAVGNPTSWGRNDWTMTPFNSMPSGKVNISIAPREYTTTADCVGTTQTYQLYLWDTVTNSTTDLGTSIPYTGILTLQPDREYWLFIGSRICGQKNAVLGCTVEYINSTYNISIWAYEPEWNCSAWSECEDNIQSRLCIDPLDKISDRVEQRTCEPRILENATLGFEETEGVIATICYPDWNVGTAYWGIWTGVSCVYIPTNITIERPINWTVSGDGLGFNRYFMDFTSEWASEGTRSLKMWTIPPKDYEWDGSSCVNRTVSAFPIIENTFSNTTMRVAYNVTFPATNMRIRFDAKTCNDQVRQNYPLNAFNETWIQIQVCPEYCYANNCNTTPNGNFYFDLYDNSINDSVFGEPIYHNSEIDGQVIERTQPIELDLSSVNLEVGKDYTLSFAVITDNPQDTRGNCIMFDDVRYDVLEEPFLDTILGGECESQCVGSDYYQARQLLNGGCLIKRISPAEYCVDEDKAEKIANLEDYCIDINTLNHYNTYSEDYEDLRCDYGCSDGHCLTPEENVTETTLANLYDPHPLLSGFLTEYGLTKENGYSIVWFFLSIFMLVNYVAMGVGTWLSKELTPEKAEKPAWEYGAIIILVIVMAAWAGGLYPLEFGIIVIAIIALFLYFTFGKAGG